MLLTTTLSLRRKRSAAEIPPAKAKVTAQAVHPEQMRGI
jgi:hypothetical protein